MPRLPTTDFALSSSTLTWMVFKSFASPFDEQKLLSLVRLSSLKLMISWQYAFSLCCISVSTKAFIVCIDVWCSLRQQRTTYFGDENCCISCYHEPAASRITRDYDQRHQYSLEIRTAQKGLFLRDRFWRNGNWPWIRKMRDLDLILSRNTNPGAVGCPGVEKVMLTFFASDIRPNNIRYQVCFSAFLQQSSDVAAHKSK